MVFVQVLAALIVMELAKAYIADAKPKIEFVNRTTPLLSKTDPLGQLYAVRRFGVLILRQWRRDRFIGFSHRFEQPRCRFHS
jgi:hypothetical protein